MGKVKLSLGQRLAREEIRKIAEELGYFSDEEDEDDYATAGEYRHRNSTQTLQERLSSALET